MRKIKSITTTVASVVTKVVRSDREHKSWYFMPLANETNKLIMAQNMLNQIPNFDSVQSVHIEFPSDKSK